MPRFEDQVTIVTGAARGIGRETARQFAAEGAIVIIADIHTSNAKRTAREILAEGGKARSIIVDVSIASQVQSMVSTVVRDLGRIDVLVNCAGIFLLNEMIVDLDEPEWNRLFDVNVKGTFLTSKYVGQEMIRQRRGVIINFSSVSSFAGIWGTGAYCASKAAVNMLTRMLALEMGPSGIRVNAVAPGFVETDINRLQIEDPVSREAFVRNFPLRRFGVPADVAHVALFLASEDAAYVNGAIVLVDAGWSAHLLSPSPYPPSESETTEEKHDMK